MRIERIELQNFRGFEHFEMDLHPEVTLLVGENGTGKTALIDALAIAGSHALYPFVDLVRPVEDDVRREVHVIKGIPDIQPAHPSRVAWSVRVLYGPYAAFLEGGHVEGWLPHQALMNALHDKIRSGASIPLPVLARYASTRRRTKEQPITEPPQSRLDLFNNWHSPSVEAHRLQAWLKKFTFVALQEQVPISQTSALQAAVQAVVPGATELVYNIRHEELRLHFADGRILPERMLSDGYRNILAMVADIAWRCAVLNPHLEERATLETEGVVLIDELELHLHPRWQHEILGTLRKAFPRIQFIATTHSPQVIASAKPEWIRILTGGDKPITPSHVEGRDTNALLEDIMGVPARPEWAKAELDKLFAAIDLRELDEARRLVTALETTLGPDDADLTRARFMLEMESL